jgi:hypothetical protein
LSAAFLARGKLAAADVEVRFGLVRRDQLVFAVSLVSVLRTDDPMLWMRSKRAYEIALLTSRPV